MTQQAPVRGAAWHPGVQAGPGIADVFFGDYNPSGKLTITFPRNVGQIPLYYNYKNTGRPAVEDDRWTSKYIDSPNTPLIPFGHGLSYSNIVYEFIKLSAYEVSENDILQIKVVVTNDSDRDAFEVIQIYMAKPEAEHFRPKKMLVGFEKVFIPANKSKTVTIAINIQDLKYWDDNKKEYKVEKGEYEIHVGNSSDNIYIYEWVNIK